MKLAEYCSYDGLGLAKLVKGRQISPRELARTGLDAIRAANPSLNAIIEVYEAAANTLDDTADRGDAMFPGVPFLLKDIGSHDAGVKFELGSRLARGMRAPPVASELISRFRSSGVTILGRTNIPELGSSCGTEPYLYGPTRNPWDLQRTPGGSSGGAAAAVASGMVPMAHANDAGGSIRWPASCCALFGLKPSRNLNPVGPDTALAVNGLAAEHIVSRSVRDTAAMLDVTAGPDTGAWCYTPRLQGSYLKDMSKPPGRLRVALNLVANFPPTEIGAEVRAAITSTARLCESLGHLVEEATFDYDPQPILEAFGIIWMTGLRATLEFLSDFTHRPVTEDTVEPHILAAYRDAAHVPAARLQWALDQMNVVARAYGQMFQRYDVMLTPAGASEPFAIGMLSQLSTATFAEWFQGMCRNCPFLSTVNIAGVPAMSVPLGWSSTGLPIGSHFIGPMGRESLLLALAAQLESAQPWIHRRPPLHVSTLP